jgi:FkbM family methyltransferase
MSRNGKSGLFLIENLYKLNWRPDAIYQIGIGIRHDEIKIMHYVWPTAKIIGFEPHPHTCKKLKGDYPGKFYEMAVGDFCGQIDLYNRGPHKDGSSIFRRPDRPDGKELAVNNVSIKTLDELFGLPIDLHVLLWLDCEGSELKVLQGGKEFLEGVEVVIVEMTTEKMPEGWCTPIEVHGCLEDYGFVCISKHKQKKNSTQYDAIYVKKSLIK